MERHPDFLNEKLHLDNTLHAVNNELVRITEINKKQEQEVKVLREASEGNYSNDLFVMEKIYFITSQAKINLTHAKDKPYFTRVDFAKDGGEFKDYYIGKWGVAPDLSKQPLIYDWRSPVANLYYSGQIGPAGYKAATKEITGEINLKRIINITKGEITSIIEADLVTQDEYLNTVLSDHADTRLRDIVTTIQKEQNIILRFNPYKPMIVQGVAGAGKTTVALHRITWLLYEYRDRMSPNNLMIIAPNPLFLNYISAVLPELGVENVIQTTFVGLAERLIGKRLPKIDDSSTLISLIDSYIPQDVKDMVVFAAKFKGSLIYKKCLEHYIKSIVRSLPPKGDVKFGSIELYTYEGILNVLEEDLSPFPISDRPKQLKKHMKLKVKQAAEKLRHILMIETYRRTNLLRAAMPDNTPTRQKRMQAIYQARDTRIREVNDLEETFVPDYFRGWKKFEIIKLYKNFLDEDISFNLPETVSKTDFIKVCSITNANMKKRKMDSNDIPALLVLQKAFFGYEEKLDIHHSILDEAQDFSPFMFNMLKDICHNASFTIVGDLNQGIHGYRGVRDWHNMSNTVFGKEKAEYFELVTSYRNTMNIMKFAGIVADRHPFPGQQPAKPVMRKGSEPKVVEIWDSAVEISAEIARMIVQGSKTVAVIEKLPNQAKKLHKALKLSNPDLQINLIQENDTNYLGGVMVSPAHLVKGLEFDAVIMADLSANIWKDDALHARLLYVCLTRPLHHLTCFYTGKVTKLISKRDRNNNNPI